MKKNDNEKILTEGNMRKLLSEQTIIILSSVDEKLSKMELKIDKKFDRLTNTLDKFLKRITDAETEFEIMKADINRMKRIIREKLGVELS